MYFFGKKTCGNLLEKDRQVCDIAGLQILACLDPYCEGPLHRVGFGMILTVVRRIYYIENVYFHYPFTSHRLICLWLLSQPGIFFL